MANRNDSAVIEESQEIQPPQDNEAELWDELAKVLVYVNEMDAAWDCCTFCDHLPVFHCFTCNAFMCREHSHCFCDMKSKWVN
jgi:hypothetical protein